MSNSKKALDNKVEPKLDDQKVSMETLNEDELKQVSGGCAAVSQAKTQEQAVDSKIEEQVLSFHCAGSNCGCGCNYVEGCPGIINQEMEREQTPNEDELSVTSTA